MPHPSSAAALFTVDSGRSPDGPLSQTAPTPLELVSRVTDRVSPEKDVQRVTAPRIHVPCNEKAMLVPPLGQVTHERPATYLTEELYHGGSNGTLIRTVISSPD